MSKLEELLRKLCPKGVRYAKLSEICTMHARIGWQALTKKEHRDSGEHLLITGTDFTSGFAINYRTCVYVDKARYDQDPNIQLKTGDILITKDGTLGKLAIVDTLPCPATLNGGLFVVRGKDGTIDSRFLLHYMSSSHFQNIIEGNHTNGTIKHLTQNLLVNFRVPVPPLPVQREIVRILDTFTAMNANLEEELAARRKQYERVLQNVTDFCEHGISENVKWMPLGESIVSLNTGLNPRRFFKLNTEDATNYYITIKEFKGGHITILPDTDMINDHALELCNHRSNLEAGDVLFSGTGTIGETVVIRETPTNWNIKEGVYAIKPKHDLLDSDYLRFLLMSGPIRNAILKKVAGGTVRSISMKDLKSILIPLPILEVQKKIASQLLLFDELCCNPTKGLQSELALRRKQYEYYRDKLLTFKEA